MCVCEHNTQILNICWGGPQNQQRSVGQLFDRVAQRNKAGCSIERDVLWLYGPLATSPSIPNPRPPLLPSHKGVDPRSVHRFGRPGIHSPARCLGTSNLPASLRGGSLRRTADAALAGGIASVCVKLCPPSPRPNRFHFYRVVPTGEQIITPWSVRDTWRLVPGPWCLRRVRVWRLGVPCMQCRIWHTLYAGPSLSYIRMVWQSPSSEVSSLPILYIKVLPMFLKKLGPSFKERYMMGNCSPGLWPRGV